MTHSDNGMNLNKIADVENATILTMCLTLLDEFDQDEYFSLAETPYDDLDHAYSIIEKTRDRLCKKIQGESGTDDDTEDDYKCPKCGNKLRFQRIASGISPALSEFERYEVSCGCDIRSIQFTVSHMDRFNKEYMALQYMDYIRFTEGIDND